MTVTNEWKVVWTLFKKCNYANPCSYLFTVYKTLICFMVYLPILTVNLYSKCRWIYIECLGVWRWSHKNKMLVLNLFQCCLFVECIYSTIASVSRVSKWDQAFKLKGICDFTKPCAHRKCIVRGLPFVVRCTSFTDAELCAVNWAMKKTCLCLGYVGDCTTQFTGINS